MPREIVRINVASKFQIEVGARFFATIAFPDNRNERERYHLALCRRYVGRYPDFASKELPIVPAIFVSSDHEYVRALERGNNKLKHRLAAALVLLPHLRDEKLKPLQVGEPGEFIIPTLNKIKTLRGNGGTGLDRQGRKCSDV